MRCKFCSNTNTNTRAIEGIRQQLSDMCIELVEYERNQDQAIDQTFYQVHCSKCGATGPMAPTAPTAEQLYECGGRLSFFPTFRLLCIDGDDLPVRDEDEEVAFAGENEGDGEGNDSSPCDTCDHQYEARECAECPECSEQTHIRDLWRAHDAQIAASREGQLFANEDQLFQTSCGQALIVEHDNEPISIGNCDNLLYARINNVEPDERLVRTLMGCLKAGTYMYRYGTAESGLPVSLELRLLGLSEPESWIEHCRLGMTDDMDAGHDLAILVGDLLGLTEMFETRTPYNWRACNVNVQDPQFLVRKPNMLVLHDTDDAHQWVVSSHVDDNGHLVAIKLNRRIP